MIIKMILGRRFEHFPWPRAKTRQTGH
jgi:hypothetical protein